MKWPYVEVQTGAVGGRAHALQRRVPRHLDIELKLQVFFNYFFYKTSCYWCCCCYCFCCCCSCCCFCWLWWCWCFCVVDVIVSVIFFKIFLIVISIILSLTFSCIPVAFFSDASHDIFNWKLVRFSWSLFEISFGSSLSHPKISGVLWSGRSFLSASV